MWASEKYSDIGNYQKNLSVNTSEVEIIHEKEAILFEVRYRDWNECDFGHFFVEFYFKFYAFGKYYRLKHGNTSKPSIYITG